jgi:hypothetical protein
LTTTDHAVSSDAREEPPGAATNGSRAAWCVLRRRVRGDHHDPGPGAQAAESRLAAAPVAAYAAVFVLVNVTYLALCWEAVDRPSREDVSKRVRRMLRMRSFVTVLLFAATAVIALQWPVVAMVFICVCLIAYVRPDIPTKRDEA